MIYTPPVDNVVSNHLLMDLHLSNFLPKTNSQQRSLTPINNQERFLGIPRQQDSITRFSNGMPSVNGGPLPPFWLLHDAVSQPLWPGRLDLRRLVGVWNLPTRKNVWFLMRKIFERNGFLCSCLPQSMPIFERKHVSVASWCFSTCICHD